MGYHHQWHPGCLPRTQRHPRRTLDRCHRWFPRRLHCGYNFALILSMILSAYDNPQLCSFCIRLLQLSIVSLHLRSIISLCCPAISSACCLVSAARCTSQDCLIQRIHLGFSLGLFLFVSNVSLLLLVV